jgi:hypothetical protein
MELQVNNSSIPLIYNFAQAIDPLGRRATEVAGDISPFAGMTVELKFKTLSMPRVTENGLDRITFSTESVPEPGTVLLVGAGLLLLLGRAWLMRFGHSVAIGDNGSSPSPGGRMLALDVRRVARRYAKCPTTGGGGNRLGRGW